TKKILNLLMSSERSLRERMFLLGGVMATIAMASASIVSLSSTSGIIPFFIFILATIIVAAVTYFSFKSRKIEFGSAIILLANTCVILPYGFITGGGVYSGSPSWFIIGLVMTFMLFTGKKFYIFYFLSIVSYGLTVYISFLHPEIVSALRSEAVVYVDVFMATILVATLIGVLLHYQSVILEREVKVSDEQHKKIEQLNEAQNRFFSAMSHEIRTPINTIIGLNEMTLRERNLSEEAIENSLNIQNASRMLLSLINDILDLSKIQSGQMELTEMQYETSRMLSEIVNLLWNRAKDKGLQFNIHIGENIPSMLYGDEIRIKQVIINLLTNAIKYTQEGVVTLTVDGEKVSANMFNLRINVQDTGQGIRKENIAAIFDSFKRFEGKANKSIEGTGLGLSITKQLVDLMNGQISVDSIYTKGSTFRVVIPQKIVSESPMTFKSVTDVNHEMKQYQQSFEAPDARVLIVDDNDMNRMVCRKLLRETKVKIDVASSGKECLEKTMLTRYDAIFMDHEMPEMDGIETLRRVRNQANGLCHNTPVIALTANAGSDRNAFYMEHGFEAYLAKPIHASLLEATLMKFLPAELIENTMVSNVEDSIQFLQSTRKKDIIITTDNICDLKKSLLEEYDIRVMPYYIVTSEGRFRDNQEMDADNLYNYILEKGKDIKTEASSIDEYENFFGDILAEAETVIHLSASSKISGGYNNALVASESFNNVHIIDTQMMSAGLGMMVIKAAELAVQGKKVEDILQEVEAYREDIVINFLLPSVDMMVRTQKVNLLTRFLVSALSVEPSVTMRNGVITVQRHFIGYLDDVTKQYVKSNFVRNKNIDSSRLYIVYSGFSDEERKSIVALINENIVFDEIIFQKASATLTANTGMRYIGFAYAKKKNEVGKEA
ncbi:MAG: DegV family EDD domain-containing protein, partial [Solobacterium sp.]|nr:DegV family EDD domain-containing protein [Solobacterium sp.]